MRASTALALVTLALAAGPVLAHEAGSADGPTLFFGFGLQAVQAQNPWPASRLPGVLEAGSPREDARIEDWSYLEAGLTMPLPGGHSGQIKVAKHGESVDPELESAWVRGTTEISAHLLDYSLGRQLMPLGFENLVHDHQRDFAVAPIALRGVLNDSWRADGVRADLELAGGFDAGLGLWLNDGFPGAPSGKPQVASLRLGWQGGDWQLEADYVHADVTDRGLVTTGTSGHTHSLPSCDVVDANRVCFSGTAKVAALAARWNPAAQPWWLAAEGFIKRDQGNLDSLFGSPDYSGDFKGGWVDFGWTFHPDLEARFRVERAVASHDVAGVNATLVANQAGIGNSDRALNSMGVAVSWRPARGHFVGLEWHREDIQPQSNQVWLLRYQYDFSTRPNALGHH